MSIKSTITNGIADIGGEGAFALACTDMLTYSASTLSNIDQSELPAWAKEFNCVVLDLACEPFLREVAIEAGEQIFASIDNDWLLWADQSGKGIEAPVFRGAVAYLASLAVAE